MRADWVRQHLIGIRYKMDVRMYRTQIANEYKVRRKIHGKSMNAACFCRIFSRFVIKYVCARRKAFRNML